MLKSPAVLIICPIQESSKNIQIEAFHVFKVKSVLFVHFDVIFCEFLNIHFIYLYKI